MMKYVLFLLLASIALVGCDAFGSGKEEDPPVIESIVFDGETDGFGQEWVTVTVSNPQYDYYLLDEGGIYSALYPDRNTYIVYARENGQASVNILLQKKDRSGFETVASMSANRE